MHELLTTNVAVQSRSQILTTLFMPFETVSKRTFSKCFFSLVDVKLAFKCIAYIRLQVSQIHKISTQNSFDGFSTSWYPECSLMVVKVSLIPLCFILECTSWIMSLAKCCLDGSNTGVFIGCECGALFTLLMHRIIP